MRRGTAGTRDIADVPCTQNYFLTYVPCHNRARRCGILLDPHAAARCPMSKKRRTSCPRAWPVLLQSRSGSQWHFTRNIEKVGRRACDKESEREGVLGLGCSARFLRTSLMENHFRNINYSTPHSAANSDRVTLCGLRPKIRAILASMILWWSFSKKHVIILL